MKLIATLVALFLTSLAISVQADGPRVLIVGADDGEYHSIQAAVDDAASGDLILIDAGTYQEPVFVTTPGITIAGVNRWAVRLDGGGQPGDGITVTADNVVVRDMTIENWGSNGVVFTHVTGFQMTRLSAYNNSEYGLYAIHSTHGDISYSYGNGHKDSAFYIGETPACHCDVHDNIGVNNMLGYSGTANSHLRIYNNEFYWNRAGILMSVLPNEMGVDDDGTIYGTQVRTEIFGNYIHDNNNHTQGSGVFDVVHPPVGEGITIAGGWFNDVHDNLLVDNHLWGVGVFWLTTSPRGNIVHDNEISGSRFGIWWDEHGEDHCFNNNEITNVQVISDPNPLPTCPGILGDLPCPGELSDWTACRASDARAPSAVKDAWLVRRALLDLDPNED